MPQPNVGATMNDTLTVADLIAILSQFDDDTEVRLAYQPSWPMEARIDPDIEVASNGVLYLAEAEQLGYAPSDVYGEE